MMKDSLSLIGQIGFYIYFVMMVIIFSAVYFEQKDYDKCIEVSEEAITIGTENRADHTLIAK